MAETPRRANDEDDDSDSFDESILKGLEVVDMWYDNDEQEKRETAEHQTSSSRASKEIDKFGRDERRYKVREHSKESDKEREKERVRERERDRERRFRERESSEFKQRSKERESSEFKQRSKEREELARKRRLEETERDLLKLQTINDRRAKMGRPLIKLPMSIQMRTLDELNARRAKEGLPLLSFPSQEIPRKGRPSKEDYTGDTKFKDSKSPEENRLVKLDHLGDDLPNSRAKKLQMARYDKTSELSRSVVGSSGTDDYTGVQKPRKSFVDPYLRRKEPEEKSGSENVCVTQVLRHVPGSSYSSSVITYKTNIAPGSVSQYSTVVETSIGEPPVAPPPPPRLGPISFKIGHSSKTGKKSATAVSDEENNDDDEEIDDDDDDFKPSRLSQRLLAATKSHRKAGTSVYKRMDDRKKVYTSDASLDSVSPTSSPERELQLSPVSSETERATSPIGRSSKLRRRHASPTYATEATAKGVRQRSSSPPHAARQRRRPPVSRSPSPPVKRKCDISHSPVETKSATRVSAGDVVYKSSKGHHHTVSHTPEPHGGPYRSPSGHSKSPTEYDSRRRQRSPFWKEIQRTLAEEQALKQKQMKGLASQRSPVLVPAPARARAPARAPAPTPTPAPVPAAAAAAPPLPPQQQGMYVGGQPPYQTIPLPTGPVQHHVPHPGMPGYAPPHHPAGISPGMPHPGGPHPGQPGGYSLPPPHRNMPQPSSPFYGPQGGQWASQSWMPPVSYAVTPQQPVMAPPKTPQQPVMAPPKPVAAPVMAPLPAAIPAPIAAAPPAVIEAAPVRYLSVQPVPPGSKTVDFVPPAPAKSKAQTKRERQLAEFQFVRPAIKPTTDKGVKQNQQLEVCRHSHFG